MAGWGTFAFTMPSGFQRVDPLYAAVSKRLYYDGNLEPVECSKLAAELRKAMKEQTP